MPAPVQPPNNKGRNNGRLQADRAGAAPETNDACGLLGPESQRINRDMNYNKKIKKVGRNFDKAVFIATRDIDIDGPTRGL